MQESLDGSDDERGAAGQDEEEEEESRDAKERRILKNREKVRIDKQAKADARAEAKAARRSRGTVDVADLFGSPEELALDVRGVGGPVQNAGADGCTRRVAGVYTRIWKRTKRSLRMFAG